MKLFTTSNSKNIIATLRSYNRKIWVGIPSYTVFPCSDIENSNDKNSEEENSNEENYDEENLKNTNKNF